MLFTQTSYRNPSVGAPSSSSKPRRWLGAPKLECAKHYACLRSKHSPAEKRRLGTNLQSAQISAFSSALLVCQVVDIVKHHSPPRLTKSWWVDMILSDPVFSPTDIYFISCLSISSLYRHTFLPKVFQSPSKKYRFMSWIWIHIIFKAQVST